MLDRPPLDHGHLPQPGMLLRSDATAKRGLWYALAIAPDGTTMKIMRLPRDTMDVASAAAYYHTTSPVDDAWQVAGGGLDIFRFLPAYRHARRAWAR